MKIIIDIPDIDYEHIKEYCEKNDNVEATYSYIYYGTPLQKNHGRLIDADRLRSMYSINQANFNTVVGIQKWIDDAPTIIEAESEKIELEEYTSEITTMEEMIDTLKGLVFNSFDRTTVKERQAIDMAIRKFEKQMKESEVEDTDQKSIEEWTAGEESKWESEGEE